MDARKNCQKLKVKKERIKERTKTIKQHLASHTLLTVDKPKITASQIVVSFE